MEFSFSTSLVPLIIGTIIPGVLSIYIWRRRKANGAAALAIMMALLFFWSSAYILELASSSFETKVLWNNITFIFIAFTPLSWMLFSLEYTERRHWLTPIRLMLLLCIPLATIIIIFTPVLRPWFWVSQELVQEGDLLLIRGEQGWWYWNVHAIYSYVALLAGVIFLVRALLKWPRQYRGQMIWSLVAISVPWVANIITIFKLAPIYIDLTPFAFSITGLGLTFAVVRYRMLDLVPIGREVVIDSMRDGVIMLDANNRVVDVNSAATHLLNAKTDIVGIGISQVLSAWPELAYKYELKAEARDEVNVDHGKAQQWLEFTRSPIADRLNRTIGGVITIRDITQIKEAQKVLLEARDKAVETSLIKSRFLAKVSHELRTPLGGILGYAELLEAGDFGLLNEKQAKAVKTILRSTEHLNDMVTELLDQAQIESNVVALQKTEFKLSDLMESAVAGIGVIAQSKGLVMEQSIDTELPARIYGDERRLRQIIINLAGNAVKFTKIGKVHVQFRQEDHEHWSIIVADTGTGIPSEAQSAIFEPFKQVKAELSMENRGIGLGLSITRELVIIMNGIIEMESSPGSGSTFKVLLPLEHIA